MIQFHRKACGVPEAVRRIIPRLVVHKRPVHELRARIVGVSVVIENIHGCHPSECEREPGNILFSSEGKFVIGHVFLIAAKADGLSNEEAREGAFRNSGAKAIGFAVRKTFHINPSTWASAPGHSRTPAIKSSETVSRA